MSQHYNLNDFAQKFEENSIWLHPVVDDDVYSFQEIF